MARFSRVVLLLMAMGFLAGAAGGAGSSTTGGVCEVSTLAAELAASCPAGGGMVTASCCEPVVASVELGTACFCRVASEMPVLHAWLNTPVLLALYTACGGARALPACDAAGPTPTAASDAVVARAVSSTVADAPDVAGVTQPAPQQTVFVTRTCHIPSTHKKLIIGLLVFNAIQLFAWFGTGMRKLYRHCYGPK